MGGRSAKEEILKRIGAVKKWEIANSAGVPYILSGPIRQWIIGVHRRYPDNTIISLGGARYINGGDEVQFVNDEDEYRNSSKRLFDNIPTLESIYKDFVEDEKNFRAVVERIRANGEGYLYANYGSFIKAYDDEYVSALPIDGILIYGPELVGGMKERYPECGNEIDTLVFPYGETFVGRYRRKLTALAIENLKGEERKKRLGELRDEFHWMHNDYKHVEELPLSFFQGELREERQKGDAALREEMGKLDNAVKTHQKAVEGIRKGGLFSEADFKKLFWVGMTAWWVDRRKEYNLTANHYIGRYLRHVCKSLKLDYDDAQFLHPWEMEKVMDGRASISDYDVNARKNGGIHFIDINDNEYFFVGKEADSLWKKMEGEQHDEMLDIIPGATACRGKATGVARIVKNPKAAKSFRDGDILVTGMTRPEYLPLMKKASAFVTDEGGVTSHAAIIARELNKPCIVGTRIATKTLKEGMLIEVDADIGEVRILKR